MKNVTPMKLSVAKCPTEDITIAPRDRGTLWLVRYRDDDRGVEGELAITQGPDAEVNARIFAASWDLLAACMAMLSTWGSDDEDAIISARDAARRACEKAIEDKS